MPKKEEVKIDIDEELAAVSLFLKTGQKESEKLRVMFEQMKLLRKNEFEKQIEKWHEILKVYEAFEEDICVNAVRVKLISKDLKNKAKIEQVSKQWQKVMDTDEAWNFDW